MIDVIKEFFARMILGGTYTVTTDNFNLGTIPFYIRYVKFHPTATGIYSWTTILPDPGHLGIIWQRRELFLLNATGISVDGTNRKLTLGVQVPRLDSTGSTKARVLYAGTNVTQSFKMLPGSCVQLLAIKGGGRFDKRWIWMVTMAAGDIST